MRVEIPKKRYFKIGEVSQLTGVEPHTIRYWESEFRQLKPRRAGSRQRLYRRDDVKLIDTIRVLLHDEKYTIAGAKRRLKKGPAEETDQAKAPAASEPVEADGAEVKAATKAPPQAEATGSAAITEAAPAAAPEPVLAEPAAKTRIKEAKTGEENHPTLFPGLNRNGINSAGASILRRVKTELEDIIKLLS